ncbi:MAG: hypothetical protein A2X36_12870 [Elusimicrobia bacterium GWA2_69_24]|nr:MAG: hypothetical protein A2X36_12870 [Elusimicrobia bacterium GWA2_69_24]
MDAVRRPAAADRFYPGGTAELGSMVDTMLAEAPAPAFDGELLGAVVPHAGYPYSGASAARVYRALRGRDIDTVAILGTAHFGKAPKLILAPQDAFQTPFGDVPVDAAVRDALAKAGDCVAVSAELHEREHSVETQLPFLQRVLPKARILPIITNLSDEAAAAAAGAALAGVLKGRKALILVASDLSHRPSAEDARRVDLATLESLQALDPGFFLRTCAVLMELGVPELHCAWCGEGAMAAGLHAMLAGGADRAQLLHYTNSGLVLEDPDEAVGYGTMLFLRTGTPATGGALRYPPEERKALLALARSSAEAYIMRRETLWPRLSENPRFNMPAGVFVTWWEGGGVGKELRGCIGVMSPDQTVRNGVAEYAVRSTQDDPRFAPVRAEELAGLAAEVSVLSPMRRSDAAGVRPGMGVELRLGARRGVFLPQVWERFPEKEEFMAMLANHKAGLPPGAWKDPAAEIRVFETESFCEA